MKPVAIVGGGITGLTAAFQLKQQGVPVRLFEAADRVGGVIQSVRSGGHLAEFGPNSILETSPIISQLVRDLGLESRRLYSQPAAEKRYIVRGKKPVEVPSSPLGFFSSPLFSWRAKLCLLAEPFHAASPPEVEESVGQFVRRRLGQEFLDYAIDPLVAGIYAGDPNRLSVPQAFPKLHALEQRYRSLIMGQILGARARKRSGEVSKQSARKFSFDDGLRVLIHALQGRLEGQIATSAPVQALRRSDEGWVVDVAHGSEAAPFECGAVLLAIPSHKLASLEITNAPALEVNSFCEVIYPPVASVVLSFRRDEVAHPLDGFGMLIPAKENFNILGALFSSSLFPNRAPEGEVTITCYLGGTRAPQLPFLPHDTLAELAAQDLDMILGAKGKPTFQHVAIYRQAIPQYNVGFGKYRTRMAEMETQAPGLFIAGHARDGVSLGDSMVSGHKVADKIHEFLVGHSHSASRLEPAAAL